jgi:Protein of unknown function (DUF4245)
VRAHDGEGRASGGARWRERDNGPVSDTRSGYRQSVGGLVGAVAMSLLLIGAVWLLSRFQQHDPINPAPTVDFKGPLAEARAAAPFPVLAPHPVPPGWRATSARWDGSGPVKTWHLGLLTARGVDAQYVGLDQSNDVPGEFLAATTRADEPHGNVRIEGAAWRVLTSSDGHETALVLQRPAVTTIVSGTASESVLDGYAQSLSAK